VRAAHEAGGVFGVTDATTPQLLGGRYELAELLGYGGMAEVYHGTDTRLGREVAVKVLRNDLARDPSFLARFRREAQSAAALSHPAIVSVYDTGTDTVDGQVTPYIVMEYVEGRTLREIVQTEGRLLPRRAVEIVAEVCGALDYSHAAGIVHRDIKPGNVMISRGGAVKVMDFGIARAVAASSAMTQTAAVIGTAQYLSPEQARGEHVDARSDVYSTGCLLYELLTGRPPFVGDSPVAVAYQHVREDPVPPSQLDPDLPPDLDAVVLKAMAKNPGNRYATAGAMAEDLDRVAAGRRVVATPVLADERTTVVVPAMGPAATAVPVLPPPSGRGRGGAYALLALAVLGVFVAAALIARALLDGGSSGKVAVPRVVGLQQGRAMQVLADAGLGVGSVTPVFPKPADLATQPKGSVISQSILDGISVARGTSVSLVVSAGQDLTTVPVVVGQSLQDALANLATARLKAGDPPRAVIADLGTVPGTVLAVAPAQGQSVPANTTVTLTVASDQALVPDVRGQDEASAAAALRAAGFTVGNRFERSSDSQAPGTIVTTNPRPGSSAARGAAVDVVVAVTPPPPPPSPSPSPSPAPTVPPTTQPPGTSPPPASTSPGATSPAPTPSVPVPTTTP